MAKNKVLGLLLALSVAAGSFAVPIGDSGLDISGSINFGARLSGWQQENYEDGDGSLVLDGYSSEADSGNSAVRARTVFSYNKEGNGAYLRFRWQDSYGTDIQVENAYGFATLFNGLVKLSGGYKIDTVWGTGAGSVGNWVDKGAEERRGIRFQVLPMEGLTLGAAFIGTQDTLVGNHTTAGAPPLDGLLSPIQHLGFTTLGAAYNAGAIKASLFATFDADKKDFDAGGGLKDDIFNYNQWDFENKGGDGGAAIKDHKYFQAAGGLSFLGIENVKLSVDFNTESAENKDGDQTIKLGVFGLGLNGQLALGALGLSAYAAIDTNSLDIGTKYEWGKFTARVTPSYKINDKVSADLRIQLAAAAFENDDYKKALAGNADDYKGSFEFVVRPTVSFNLGNGVSFYTRFNYTSATSSGNKETASVAGAPNPVKDAKNSQTLQFEFTYSF